MNREQVWELVRRLRLRLVVDNDKTSDNRGVNVLRKERHIEMLREKSGLLRILCQPLEKIPTNSKNLPGADKIDKRLVAGGLIAQSPGVARSNSDQATVDMIANAGELSSSRGDEIPNDYQFEIIRLRRRVEELECIVRDRDSRVVAALSMLEDELSMYRSLLHDHVAETHDGISRRILRIESTLSTLKEKGSKFYPPLEVPERWQKP